MKVTNRLIAEAMADLEAMLLLHKVRLVPDGAVKPDQLFCYLLCFSAFLHGLILVLPVSFGNRASNDLKPRLIQAKIRVQMLHTPSHGWSEAARTGPRFANPSPTGPDSARATPRRPAQRFPTSHVIALPESDASSQSSFNLEEFREQARSLAKEPPDQLFRGANPYLHVPAKAVSDLTDRPILEALSKRLGNPLLVLGEQILNDGSRHIRFSGNRCLHIPRHLPIGGESQFTQTILLPTNCP